METRLGRRSMTNDDGNVPKARRSDVGDDAARPGRSPGRPIPTSDVESPPSGPETEVELDLADLIGDANGEVVFCNDSGFRTLGLRTHAGVVADGRSGRRVTAGGEDVSGFKYVTFDNGLTLYYGSDIDLIVRRPT